MSVVIRTTPNYRRVVLRLTEDALRNFGGLDCDRETASTLLAVWPCRNLLDEELTAEVLGRFAPAEPPAVEGKDYLAPAVVTDWSQYGWCPKCDAPAGEVCCSTVRPRLGMARTRPHIQRPMVARPLVVVQPDAEAVQQHGIGSADKGSDGLYRRCLCGEEFTGRDLADLAEQIMAHERRVQS
jgi:hypothetical protein